MNKHVILFLAANPLETSRIAIDREVRAIRDELEHERSDGLFEFVARLAARTADLRDGLTRFDPTVVHFSGHGARQLAIGGEQKDDVVASDNLSHGLIFEGSDGRSQFVSADAMQAMFSVAAAAPVRLVVLNAAYSDVVADALLAHVECAVGFSGAIQEEAARTFMIAFYGGLATRQSIASCYRMGRAAIIGEGMLGAEFSRLVVRHGVDAERLFVVDHPDQTPSTAIQQRDIRAAEHTAGGATQEVAN